MAAITINGEWSIAYVRGLLTSTWNGNLRRALVAGGDAGMLRRAVSPANGAWYKSDETMNTLCEQAENFVYC